MAQDQKKAKRQRRTIVWVDQSGFYLLPALVRTYAPRGQTPRLRVKLTRDHLSVISALSLQGKLYMKVQQRAFTSEDVVRFLKHLLRHMAGKLLVIWDGSPIHRGQAVKDFVTSPAGQRIQLEQLPGYAPELNADEGIWRYLKQVELRNVLCQDLAQLHNELRKATQRLRHRLDVLLGCIRHAGCVV